MANKQIKQYSTSLVNPEMQTKITTRYNYMPTKMALIKKQKMPSVAKDVEKPESSYILVRHVK